MNKREKLKIIEDLLKIIKKNPRIKITKLLHLSNLSHPSFRRYINLLLENGLIKGFILTEKGSKLIKALEVRNNLIPQSRSLHPEI